MFGRPDWYHGFSLKRETLEHWEIFDGQTKFSTLGNGRYCVMSTMILRSRDVRMLLNMREVIDAVEKAFAAYADGQAKMPPKAYLSVDNGDFRAMPAFLPGAAGLKWVNVHPCNPNLGLPTVMATLILNDPANGYPLAIMDATELTAFRTGAAAAIASKYMAKKDTHSIGLVGAGRQAYTQLLAHAELFTIQDVRVFDRNNSAVSKFVASFPGLDVHAASLEETAAADIVCTVTPAREPLLMKRHIRPGTHINAIGADAAGKEELEPSLLNDSVVVVDDLTQAAKAGEINIPVSTGLFRIEQVFATLGELVSGRKVLSRNSGTITVFDSTGVAIEDLATAQLIYEKAKRIGTYSSVDMVEAC